MGQAKQRGTFEQRQAEGIAKRQERERQQAKEKIIREGMRNQPQNRQAGILLAAVMAMSHRGFPWRLK
jgi:hypothetical protein